MQLEKIDDISKEETTISVLSYYFDQSDYSRIFENLNFYFMKTANIPVHGNIELSV